MSYLVGQLGQYGRKKRIKSKKNLETYIEEKIKQFVNEKDGPQFMESRFGSRMNSSNDSITDEVGTLKVIVITVAGCNKFSVLDVWNDIVDIINEQIGVI